MHRSRTILTTGVLALVVSASLGTGLATATPASWGADLDCTGCHEAESARAETVHGTLPCVTCHSDGAVLEDVHKDADPEAEMPKKLKETEVDEKTCLACHGEGTVAGAAADEKGSVAEKDAAVGNDAAKTGEKATADAGKPSDASAGADAAAAKADSPAQAADDRAGWAALAELTAGSEALTDSEGTVVNPHDLPAVKEHADITCVSCHRPHAEDADATKTALKLCRSCHHEDVFACYTCHA